jgi:hypothetical protein
MQNHHDSSDFLTSSTGAEKAGELGLMTPLWSMVAQCRFSSTF